MKPDERPRSVEELAELLSDQQVDFERAIDSQPWRPFRRRKRRGL